MQSKHKLILVTLLSATLAGCAGLNGFWDDLRGTPKYYSYSNRERPIELLPVFPRHCIGADTEVLDISQCNMASASCYQLDTGSWCSSPYTVADTNYMPVEPYAEPQK